MFFRSQAAQSPSSSKTWARTRWLFLLLASCRRSLGIALLNGSTGMPSLTCCTACIFVMFSGWEASLQLCSSRCGWRCSSAARNTQSQQAHRRRLPGGEGFEDTMTDTPLFLRRTIAEPLNVDPRATTMRQANPEGNISIGHCATTLEQEVLKSPSPETTLIHRDLQVTIVARDPAYFHLASSAFSTAIHGLLVINKPALTTSKPYLAS